MKKIGIAADHAGFAYKEEIVKWLLSKGYDFVDFGTFTPESVDYPDMAHLLGAAVDRGEVTWGIAICGSGNGINIALNKHQKVRSALCWTSEIAGMARLHNDANVCALPARYIDLDVALQAVDTFLHTSFESGGRHQRRVDKIPC